ncbi:MAG TPA: hypothetical protein VLK84_24760 [Longimicrobium sp.]|nr:hypothetical protein [Longimicrobium sp.]
MKQTRARTALLLCALVLAAGCEMVHSRIHGFDWMSTESLPGIGVDIVTTGTDAVQDSAGFLIARRTSPYWVGVYFTRQSPVPVEVLRVTFTGKQTGRVITPPMAPSQGLGDGTLTLVSVAPSVPLPFEDYRVDVQVRIGAGTEARDAHVTGTLSTRLEQGKSPRFWESLMSV